MDISIAKEKLKKEYNCQLISIINYANIDFIKALDDENEEIYYRYFKVGKEDELEEILDDLLLAYFRKMNETNQEENY